MSPSDPTPSGAAPGSEAWPISTTGAAAGPGTEVSSPPAALSGAPNAWALLRALRRRWMIAVLLSVTLGGALGAAAWLFLPTPAHVVRAQLYVSASQPVVLFKGLDQGDFNSFRQTQLALIKSRLVLNAALRQPKVAELSIVRQETDPIAWLEREIKVTSPTSPELVTITLSGEKPEELKVLVDAVVNAYLQEIVNKDQVKRQARLDQLKEIAAKYDENLRRKRRALRELAESVGSGDKQAVALKQMYIEEQYHLVKKELLQVRSELRRLQLESNGEDGQALPAAAIAEAVDKDPVIIRHVAIKSQLEEQMALTIRNAVQGEKHPRAQQLKEAIEDAEQMIARRRTDVQPKIEEQLRERSRMAQATAGTQLVKRIEFYKRLEKQLIEESTRLEEGLHSLNKGSLDLNSIKNEILQAEEIAKRVNDEVEKLGVELQAPARIYSLEPALVDWGESKARHTRMALMAGIAGLLIGLVGVAWWEFRSRRVDSPDQIVHGLGMKLVGTVPAQPSWMRMKGSSVRTGKWQSALHESVNAAREMLLHTARAEGVRVVMITSAVAGEGKTSLATQLASSLARAGRKTLLIDCDLRNPAAHRVFELPGAPGLSEILRHEIDPADALQDTTVHGLRLIPAGHWDNEAMVALASGGIEDVFRHLRPRFDFIVVDTSPVLPVADAMQVGQHVDGVIFSILRNVSQLPRVYTASQRLMNLGMRLMGAVVLGTREDHGSYGYNYVSTPAKNA